LNLLATGPFELFGHVPPAGRVPKSSNQQARVLKGSKLVAYESLQIKNMVKNHCLAKSISDAGWYQFRIWIEYYAKIFEPFSSRDPLLGRPKPIGASEAGRETSGFKFGRIAIGVKPQYTSQKCSACGNTLKKSLSTRTHVCKCGCRLDRDENAARNILATALKEVGWGTSELNASGDMDLWRH